MPKSAPMELSLLFYAAIFAVAVIVGWKVLPLVIKWLGTHI